jgi:hypothetical protein
MGYLNIRDLQKISGESISALPGATAVKSGARTVGLLIPMKLVDADALTTILRRAEYLAGDRDAKADDEALAAFGDVDPVNWSEEAVSAMQQRDR